MKAMLSGAPGAPLALGSAPLGAPGPDEIVIEIAAAGVNFADTLMLEDRYQSKPTRPFAPGLEAAGRIVETGPEAALAPGTRVAALLSQGGFAERAVAKAALCRPVPDSVPDPAAAVLPVAFGSTLVALETLAQARPGERLLVTGAAGGVGLAAVEIGALMGLEVVAAARGADRLATAKAFGAAHLIDVETEDLRAAVKDLGGADIVYDAVGGETWEAALRATRPGARLLPIGFAGGAVPQIPANYLLVKNLSVFGFWLGGYAALHPAAFGAALQTLIDWVAAGRLQPRIDAALPLEAANDALERLRARRVAGKIVLTPGRPAADPQGAPQ